MKSSLRSDSGAILYGTEDVRIVVVVSNLSNLHIQEQKINQVYLTFILCCLVTLIVTLQMILILINNGRENN